MSPLLFPLLQFLSDCPFFSSFPYYRSCEDWYIYLFPFPSRPLFVFVVNRSFSFRLRSTVLLFPLCVSLTSLFLIRYPGVSPAIDRSPCKKDVPSFPVDWHSSTARVLAGTRFCSKNAGTRCKKELSSAGRRPPLVFPFLRTVDALRSSLPES